MTMVALPLAHPLTPAQVEQIGAADVRMYTAGETIVVPSASALTVIRAGWAQVDPNDQRAVAAALAVRPPADSTGATAPAAPGPAAVSSSAASAMPPQARQPVAGTGASGT